ncbi:hypothetical protein UFOVP341_11 [uncultured Caudovirales phage]|uniref:PD-(D/E)XK nuclease superfamily n=1 Tax=uncultured Caudovirales phage TaxID=2100421 RepID=A0A6J5LZU5_9CAUD|nr:hypothetical protein UFOVP341_11 [uncultured Caudovirales phage]
MFQDNTPDPVASAVVAILGDAMLAKRAGQERRQYLGASMWGDPCDRKLGFMYHQAKPDAGFKPEVLRIFDMGHDGESRMAEYLKAAGFQLLTAGEDGKQFGFSAGGGKLKGHIDGVIIAGPAGVGITWPALWENKALNEKGFKEAVTKGIKVAKPLYYAQAQVYMAYMELQVCLFTVQNRNTGEVHAEIIPFDALAAQEASDRAVRVVSSSNPTELNRIGRDTTDFRCKFCDFKGTCWAQPTFTTPQPTTPKWLKK